jgi:uncharacterized SAM-binding protein YcdF (DUF218 family)
LEFGRTEPLEKVVEGPVVLCWDFAKRVDRKRFYQQTLDSSGRDLYEKGEQKADFNRWLIYWPVSPERDHRELCQLRSGRISWSARSKNESHQPPAKW